MSRRTLLLVVLVAASVAGALAVEPPVRQALAAAAVALLFLAATSAGTAGKAATALGALRDRPVSVRVWGAPLPDGSPEGFQLVRVRAFGAGLHLLLRTRSGDGSVHELKVAQPRGVAFDRLAGRAVIRDAKYLQWRRQRLRQPADFAGAAAVELELLAVREGVESPSGSPNGREVGGRGAAI